MKFRKTTHILLLLVSLIVGFSICEFIARRITRVNQDGQVFLKHGPLLPGRFPAKATRQKLNYFFKKRDQAYVVDDPVLGWTIAPNRKSENGLYASNSMGIRSRPREYTPDPPPGVLRVALFGDSFTHGDEEPYEKTWGYFLEEDLKREGVRAEVINFGVGGFGIGQAYLRWDRLGRDFSPRIAVFGFQSENMKRVVNIFRPLYSRRTWLVFSKPRFILDQQGELQLINCPVVDPKNIPEILENFKEHPLSRYEFWYNPKNYFDSFWLKSRFLQIIYNRFRQPRRDHREGSGIRESGGQPEDVTLAIMKRFAREVREAGGIPIILHIPKKSHLELVEKGITPAYYSLFEELEKEGVLVVDPVKEMEGKHRLYKRSHFSSRGGKIVARVLAGAISNLLERKNEGRQRRPTS